MGHTDVVRPHTAPRGAEKSEKIKKLHVSPRRREAVLPPSNLGTSFRPITKLETKEKAENKNQPPARRHGNGLELEITLRERLAAVSCKKPRCTP